jgi:eukaryotic-like serine/threonine-protein kinase
MPIPIPLPGTLVASRYEIVSTLGRGGMATVFRAVDHTLGDPVALKILHEGGPSASDFRRRFRTEIRLARKVSHWNVCRIHDYGEDADLVFISMELIDGLDLRRAIAEYGPFSVPDAFDIAMQVAQGLEAIHRAGIVHRDLKTANLMRDASGRVRVMDFGIAKSLGKPLTRGTGADVLVGTPEYMSPEQIRGERIDHRSDIFAFAAVVYEVFTGHLPHSGDTPVDVMLNVLNDPPDLDARIPVGLPPALRPVLARALSKQPSERFDTVAAMAASIEDARTRHPPPERTLTVEKPMSSPAQVLPSARSGTLPRPRPPRSPARWSGKPRGVIALGLALSALVGLGLLGRAWLRPGPELSKHDGPALRGAPAEMESLPTSAATTPGTATEPPAPQPAAPQLRSSRTRSASSSADVTEVPAAGDESTAADDSTLGANTPDPPREAFTLPIGTELLARIGQSLRSDTVRPGQEFPAMLDEPVRLGSREVLQAGTRLTGRVDAVAPPGSLPRMTLSLVRLEIEPRPAEIRTAGYELVARASDPRTRVGAIVIGGVVGAALGAAVGGSRGGVAGAVVGAGAGAPRERPIDPAGVEFVFSSRLPFKLVEPLRLAAPDAIGTRREP